MTDEPASPESTSDSLIDAKPEAAAKPDASTEATKAALAFTFDDKALETVFGKADKDGRPEHLAAKYWDPDKKAVKADVVFNQLRWAEGKLGKKIDVLGGPGEGKDYEVKAPEGTDLDITPDNPMVKGLLSVAKKYDLSQNVITDVVAEVAKELGVAVQTNQAEELKKLGPNAAQRLTDLGDYLRANLEPGQLAQAKQLITTAEGFEVIEALISKGQPPKLASKEDTHVANQGPTKADWEAKYFAKNEHGERLVAIDPQYRKEVEALRDRVFGTARKDASGRVMNG